MTIDFSQWKLVPVAATREMEKAASAAWLLDSGSLAQDTSTVYAAMLTASPSPPVDVAGLVRENERLREACQTLLDWEAAENNARPYAEDNGAGWHERLALCQLAHDRARAALTHQEK